MQKCEKGGTFEMHILKSVNFSIKGFTLNISSLIRLFHLQRRNRSSGPINTPLKIYFLTKHETV